MKVISLGMGVQSTAMYYMSSMGILPRADNAIFADTGREKTATLTYLDFLKKWQHENNGIPIIVIHTKLYEDLMQKSQTDERFAKIPAFTKNEDSIGMLQRQCTYDYKILPIDKEIRSMCGMKHGQRMTTNVEVWKGISLDEYDRMSYPNVGWKTHVYPFVGYSVSKKDTRKFDGLRMSRADIRAWYEKNNLPIPVKSSCVFCPYQSDAAWARLKKDFPEDFSAAVEVDEKIRDMSKKGIKSPVFLHKTCKPLKDIPFDAQMDLWHGECTDNCHI